MKKLTNALEVFEGDLFCCFLDFMLLFLSDGDEEEGEGEGSVVVSSLSPPSPLSFHPFYHSSHRQLVHSSHFLVLLFRFHFHNFNIIINFIVIINRRREGRGHYDYYD